MQNESGRFIRFGSLRGSEGMLGFFSLRTPWSGFLKECSVAQTREIHVVSSIFEVFSVQKALNTTSSLCHIP